MGIIVLGIGGTLAYFTSTGVFDNIFNTAKYKTIAHEEFTSPSNWKPGDETPKTVTVKNEGDIGANVRVCVEDYWIAENNNRLSNHSNALNMDIALLNLDNTSDWSYADGCYYYNEVLEPNAITTSPIKSVTFNPNYQGSINCITEVSTGDLVCESTSDGYDNAEYHLSLRIDTIQHEGLGE